MATTNDSLLEMYLHGDLPAALRKKAEALAATPEGKARLEALRESDASILRELPVPQWSDKIRRRAAEPAIGAREAKAPAGRWVLASGFAFSLALLALVVAWKMPTKSTDSVHAIARSDVQPGRIDSVLPSRPADAPTGGRVAEAAPAKSGSQSSTETVIAMVDAPDDGLRTKGGVARMRIHRLEPGSTETVSMRDGDQAGSGTTLQVALLAGPRCWIAVMSVDGAGQVSRHIPETGDSSVLVKEPLQAAHSFQIDDAPGFERFVLVESERPFALSELESLLAKARGDKNLPVRKGWGFQSLRVQKPEARK